MTLGFIENKLSFLFNKRLITISFIALVVWMTLRIMNASVPRCLVLILSLVGTTVCLSFSQIDRPTQGQPNRTMAKERFVILVAL